MEDILEKLRLPVGVIFWLIVSIIIPATVSFTVLQAKIDTAHARIVIVDESEKQLRSDLNTLEAKLYDNDAKLYGKLEVIHKELGEVKGELKRLK